nr:MAG TPA: hypothetical protein [Caudoviricetes sp.]
MQTAAPFGAVMQGAAPAARRPNPPSNAGIL